MRRHVFVTGSTGYIGSRLIPRLLQRGHAVRALTRNASLARVPAGCESVIGNALDAATYADRVPPADTFVHLVGVPHPNPSKAQQFKDVDLVSALASIDAAKRAAVDHFVYVSVAQPAPIMKAYQQARRAAEEALLASGLAATIVRPWYVLGPGHWWPVAFIPMYAVLELLPSTRTSARRLGLVTIGQMVAALVEAIERPTHEPRIVDVPAIRAAGRARPPSTA